MKTRITSDAGKSSDSILVIQLVEESTADLLEVKLEFF